MICILPYAWAHPFQDEDAASDCDHPDILPIAVSFPILACCLSFCFCVPLLKPSGGTAHGTCFCVALGSFVMFGLAVRLLVTPGACDGDKATFALSLGVINATPLGLVFVFGIVFCLLGLCVACAEGCGSARQAIKRQASKERTPTAQKILRNAMVFGDSFMVDLLIDIHGRGGNPCWRFYRCMFLGCMHGQFRWSCCTRRACDPRYEEQDSTRIAPRASLSYCYVDGEGGYPVHYLCRGSHSARSSTHVHRRAFGCFRRFLRSLPERTDSSRARILQELLESGHLGHSALLGTNSAGETSLHCAASTGSMAVLQVILARLDSEMGFFTKDKSGNTPCDVALRGGCLRCAQLLAGPPGLWPGMSRLQPEGTAVQACLQDALQRLQPHGQSESVDQAFRTPLVHQGSKDVLVHLDIQLDEFSRRVKHSLPREAVEGLLRSHAYSVDAAVLAYCNDAQLALDSAGLSGFGSATARSNDGDSFATAASSSTSAPTRNGAGMCIVCFDDVAEGSSACRSLACKHVTCDECLRTHVDVRLREGDFSGIVCPEPSCRLPISEGMLVQLFEGSESPQLLRFQELKAQKFVDTHGATAWCPKPGCGRAVSLVASSCRTADSQAAAAGEIDVTCACKTKFCFNCKEIGGHEPVSCDYWKSWQTKLTAWQRENNDASEQWVAQNSRECKCGAKIQRNGGCNHMTCTVCGAHFCYVCGQSWSLHRTQPGGFDYYQCRLNAAGQNTVRDTSSTPTANLQRFDACFSGWCANARDPARQEALAEGLIYIASAFDQDIAYEAVAMEGMQRCLEARTCLRHCYVLKYHWTEEDWRRRLNTWVGDLEGVTGALENVLGLMQIESLIQSSDRFRSTNTLPAHPSDLVRHLDLKSLAPRVLTACDSLSVIQQLSTAVELQTRRIFDAARHGFPVQSTFEPIEMIRHVARTTPAHTASVFAWRLLNSNAANCTTM